MPVIAPKPSARPFAPRPHGAAPRPSDVRAKLRKPAFAGAADSFDEAPSSDPVAQRMQSKQSRAGRRDDEAVRRHKREQIEDFESDEV